MNDTHLLSDRYRLGEEIGSGGAGRVHRAHDQRLDRPVAVKILTDLSDTAVARFRREAATAARVHHRNVVTLHDAGIDEAPYLVMSLVEGPSLAQRVTEQGPLTPEEVRSLASDLLAGLRATHAAGVLHRDLTPRNVLFDETGTALLADFGIARGADDPTLTAAHTIMGTRPFVAPERLRGQDATIASDLYSVGVTLQFAVTGSLEGPMPADHPLAPFVAACTADDPGRRPADAEAAEGLLDTLDPAPPRTAILPVEQEETVAIVRSDDTVALPATPPIGVPVATDSPTAGDSRSALGPATVIGLLLAALVAAVIGSTAVRGNDPGATVDDAPAGVTATGSPQPDAPGFDSADPARSARELAEWLRSRDG